MCIAPSMPNLSSKRTNERKKTGLSNGERIPSLVGNVQRETKRKERSKVKQSKVEQSIYTTPHPTPKVSRKSVNHSHTA